MHVWCDCGAWWTSDGNRSWQGHPLPSNCAPLLQSLTILSMSMSMSMTHWPLQKYDDSAVDDLYKTHVHRKHQIVRI